MIKIYSNPILGNLEGVQNNHETNRMTLIDLCTSIYEGNISIPLYQRDQSWQLNKAVDLFEYQLKGKAPVAPVSFNSLIEKGKRVPQISFIERIPVDDIETVKYSVVDGQQRLTTNLKACIDHKDFKKIIFDLNKGSFLLNKSDLLKKYQIPVGILLNFDEDIFYEYTRDLKLHKTDSKNLRNIRSKIHNYMYTVHIGKDLDIQEQIEWFEKLNNAGSKVTKIQMGLCKLKIIGFDIYVEYIRPYQDLLRTYGLYDALITPLTTKESYPIAALNPAYEVLMNNGKHGRNYAPIASDATNKNFLEKYSDMRVSEKDELEFSFDQEHSFTEIKNLTSLTIDALKVVLQFLKKNNLVELILTFKRIEYVQFILGYVVFNKIRHIDDSDGAYIIKWINDVRFNDKSNTEKRDIYTNFIFKRKI
ncbi:DUF262 domain-containing protein [Acinetobacter faecalis]|uniref:DUF262 domain-containing protein n=1 Tax=Acinetobacter faecalis TaxID=2665161 RepID=UPI002A91263E|nr:DUF262 domain-containing protein [Acinetobacter faecalis]MDY6449536.1 DUF262 domain-containing protein [Acinetobacter faecalis]